VPKTSSANLALVAAWGVAGLVIAMLALRWEPRR
jgi:hypothetical protein